MQRVQSGIDAKPQFGGMQTYKPGGSHSAAKQNDQLILVCICRLQKVQVVDVAPPKWQVYTGAPCGSQEVLCHSTCTDSRACTTRTVRSTHANINVVTGFANSSRIMPPYIGK
jgi:hypothetical protein